MKRQPLVSIVIPVRNEEKNIKRLLSFINRLDYPKSRLEVIIVDGMSTDKTVELSKRFNVKIIKNPLIIRV